MGLSLRAVAATDVGRHRANNEDAAFAGERLIAIADGIGGMPAGELASQLTIAALTPLDHEPAPADPVEALRQAVEEANLTIRARGEADAASYGMGTTVTALLLTADRIALLHVGDSRGYRLREGQLLQLTRDDTLVQTLVDQGLLSAEEARVHPRKSVVMQALLGSDFDPTLALLPVAAGDRFLLCSDGLSDVVTDDVIAATLAAQPDLGACAATLIQLALDAGGPDNVTVVVADAVPTHASASPGQRAPI